MPASPPTSLLRPEPFGYATYGGIMRNHAIKHWLALLHAYYVGRQHRDINLG